MPCSEERHALMGAPYLSRPEPEPKPEPVTRKPALCPECGSPVRNWWQDNPADPGDVDPRADCTNPSCGWGY